MAELPSYASLRGVAPATLHGLLSGGLGDCARAGDAAVPAVLDALEEVLPVLPRRRDAGSFLELTADLAERTGRSIDLPPELLELADGKSSSVLAQAARRLRR